MPTQVKAPQIDSNILGGWIPVTATWTYSSADDPTYVVTVPSGAASLYSAGMRVKFTNNATTFYGIITAVSDTTLTLYGGTDYDVANSAITAVYYSAWKAPLGFPLDPLKWTIEYTSTDDQTQSTPTSNTWYNLGTASLDIPIGSWDVEYSVYAFANLTSGTGVDVKATLSTANNSQSDSGMTAAHETGNVTATGVAFYRRKALLLASKTTHYLNTVSASASLNAIYNFGSRSKTIIRATSAYL